MEDDILDSAVKGGSDWLSYEVRLKKKRAPGDRSSLPTGNHHNRSKSNARATSIEQQVNRNFYKGKFLIFQIGRKKKDEKNEQYRRLCRPRHEYRKIIIDLKKLWI